MSLNGLVNSGRPNCGVIEKMADAVLAFPKGIWFGKKVTIEKSGNQYVAKHEKHQNFTSGVGKAMVGVSGIYPLSCVFQLMIGVVYAGACVAASPFLGLGLALKKLALKTDKAANIYKTLVEDELQKEQLNSKIDSLKQMKTHVDAKIQELQPLQETVAKQPELGKYLKVKPAIDIIWYKKKSEEIPKRIAEFEIKLKKVDSHYEKSLKNMI